MEEFVQDFVAEPMSQRCNLPSQPNPVAACGHFSMVKFGEKGSHWHSATWASCERMNVHELPLNSLNVIDPHSNLGDGINNSNTIVIQHLTNINADIPRGTSSPLHQLTFSSTRLLRIRVRSIATLP